MTTNTSSNGDGIAPVPYYVKTKVPADATGNLLRDWDDVAPPELVAEWERQDNQQPDLPAPASPAVSPAGEGVSSDSAPVLRAGSVRRGPTVHRDQPLNAQDVATLMGEIGTAMQASTNCQTAQQALDEDCAELD
jgi:hypothetical protein